MSYVNAENAESAGEFYSDHAVTNANKSAKTKLFCFLPLFAAFTISSKRNSMSLKR